MVADDKKEEKPADYHKAKELFAAGRLVARAKAKYMRAILLAFAPVEMPGLGTIGVTEHGVLLIDWDFVYMIYKAHEKNEERAAKQMGGALVHEAFHVLLEHCKRRRQAQRDPRLGNIADDMSFNDAIIDMGLELPTYELPTGESFKPVHAADFGWPRGETSDQYYERLKQKQQSDGGSSGDDQDDDGDQEGGGSGGQPGKKPSKGKGKGTPGKRPGTGGGWCG